MTLQTIYSVYNYCTRTLMSQHYSQMITRDKYKDDSQLITNREHLAQYLPCIF